ncbi:MAG: glycosyltransferase family 4 protein [Alphaproteobacteria bacterium]
MTISAADSPNATAPRVFLFSCAERFGGAEVYLAGLALELARRGSDVALVCGTLLVEPMRHRLGGAAITILSEDAVVWDWTKDATSNIRRQAAFLDSFRSRHDPFISFINLNWLNVAAGLLQALADEPHRAVIHVHLCPHSLNLSEVERIILSDSVYHATWSVVSADNRRFIARSLGLDPDEAVSRIDVIYNGAANVEGDPGERNDTARRTARRRVRLPDERSIVLSIGRHDTQKGFEEALTVMQRLQPLLPALLYVWVGGGTLFDRHRQMVVDTGLEATVWLFAERPDIADFYRAADLYYMPTKYEGFALAMLEAAFYGLPIVMNDISSAREFVPEGLDECLVPPLRTWQHVWRLHDLLSGPVERRVEIGAALQRRGQRFTRSGMYGIMCDRVQKLVVSDRARH